MLSLKKIMDNYGVFVESNNPDEEAMLKGILAVHGINVRTILSSIRKTTLTLTPVKKAAPHDRPSEDKGS